MGAKEQRWWSRGVFGSTIKGGQSRQIPEIIFPPKKNLTPSTKEFFCWMSIHDLLDPFGIPGIFPQKNTPSKGICWMKCRNLSVSWRGSIFFHQKQLVGGWTNPFEKYARQIGPGIPRKIVEGPPPRQKPTQKRGTGIRPPFSFQETEAWKTQLHFGWLHKALNPWGPGVVIGKVYRRNGKL